MGFLPLNAKPGKRGKLRPILKKRWSEDYLAAQALASNNGGRALLKGPTFVKSRLFNSASSGEQVPGSDIGGGEA